MRVSSACETNAASTPMTAASTAIGTRRREAVKSPSVSGGRSGNKRENSPGDMATSSLSRVKQGAQGAHQAGPRPAQLVLVRARQALEHGAAGRGELDVRDAAIGH